MTEIVSWMESLAQLLRDPGSRSLGPVLVFNVIGAVAWVGSMTATGYLLGT